MSEINSSYPFASTRVKAIESKLITKEKLSRIIEAKDFDMAMRILAELGYGQTAAGIHTGTASFEDLIQRELAETDSLLETLSPDDTFTRIVRAEKDYYNLKVLIKLFMQSLALDSVTLSPGNFSVDTMRRAISENNYRDLSETMQDALNYIDKQFSVESDASIVGIALDRAYAKDISEMTNQMNDPLISAYFEALFDLTNIIALFRIRAAGLSKDSFDRNYLKGGRIDKSTLSDAFDLPGESIPGAAAKGIYASILADAFDDYAKTGSLYMMEKARDDYLLKLLKEQQHDMFSIGPLMAYYVAKQREAAAVRLVMTAKQGGIDADVVNHRLKDLF